MSEDKEGSDNKTGVEDYIGSEDDLYVLRLYIAGMSRKSTGAIARIKNVCERHLRGRYHLEVIDIYQQPQLAEGEQIIAVPTLVKKLPSPLRRLVGDLSNEEKVLVGLDLLDKRGDRER